MAEIGATLREARMRQRIDITDMEVRTKIRAKYLRALENEEWDLLPGPTYVRSFLRTYADALDLDSKGLVEEYKLRHDPQEAAELHPIRRQTPRERDRGRRAPGAGGGGFPRGAAIGLVLAAIIVALFLVGRGAEDDSAGPERQPPVPAATEPEAEAPASTQEEAPRPRPRTVRLQLVPTGPVSVCLVDARGRVLIGNEILQAGASTQTFRSRRFRMVLGNNAIRLRVNGKNRTVPPSSVPIALELTPRGRRTLQGDRQPTCT
jgi:hypothetical protein